MRLKIEPVIDAEKRSVVWRHACLNYDPDSTDRYGCDQESWKVPTGYSVKDNRLVPTEDAVDSSPMETSKPVPQLEDISPVDSTSPPTLKELVVLVKTFVEHVDSDPPLVFEGILQLIQNGRS